VREGGREIRNSVYFSLSDLVSLVLDALFSASRFGSLSVLGTDEVGEREAEGEAAATGGGGSGGGGDDDDVVPAGGDTGMVDVESGDVDVAADNGEDEEEYEAEGVVIETIEGACVVDTVEVCVRVSLGEETAADELLSSLACAALTSTLFFDTTQRTSSCYNKNKNVYVECDIT
jgi:hypothetical protein